MNKSLIKRIASSVLAAVFAVTGFCFAGNVIANAEEVNEYPFAIMIQSSDYSFSGQTSLGGAEFSIYNAETNELVKTIVTRNIPYGDPNYDYPFEGVPIGSYCGPYHGNAYGVAETNLPVGNYYIVEEVSADGFVCSEDCFDFEIGIENIPGSYKYGTIIFPEEIDVHANVNLSKGGSKESIWYFADMMNQLPELGRIKIKRFYPDDNEKDLSGAVYEIKNLETGNVVRSSATNASGEVCVTGLFPGNYEVVEVEVSEDFILNDAPHEVKVGAREETVVENEALTEIVLNPILPIDFGPITFKPTYPVKPIKPIIPIPPKPIIVIKENKLKGNQTFKSDSNSKLNGK